MFWWRGESGHDVNNFGDRLNTWLLRKLNVHHEWAAPADAELMVLGSILDHPEVPKRWHGTVCGAGKLRPNTTVDLSDARVFALRGQHTLDSVTGLGDRQPVLGDPGLLAPKWVRPQTASYDLGVIPHWSDTELADRFSYGHLIDPTTMTVQETLTEISRCKRIVSSSLHGLIVADAFGIPRQAELFERAQFEGGDFKYRDYQSIYEDTDVHFGEMWLAPRDTVERVQQELYDALLMAIGFDLSMEDGREPQMSILVPFRDDGEHRSRLWHWLRRYWRAMYPEAEIVQGYDDGTPFSKSAAVNNAARHARGRTFAVIDADAYLPVEQLKICGERIDRALDRGKREWFIPYTNVFRLTEAYTKDLLHESPRKPFPLPPDPANIENHSAIHYGHKFGAMAQVMPREAFLAVEGMDPAFRGWGCEDAAFLRSLDTLYAQHHVLPGAVAHLWHAKAGGSTATTRQWVGQSWGNSNSRLFQRYINATAEPAAMQGLADEHKL